MASKKDRKGEKKVTKKDASSVAASSVAASASSTAALIVSKFNRRYKHNLENLLIVYGSVATAQNEVSQIRMKEIDFDNFTLGFHLPMVEFEILKPIPYEDSKRCKDWADVESSIKDMCAKAAAKRGYSEICLKKVVYPNDVLGWLLVGCIMLLILGHYSPDLVYDTILGWLPYSNQLKPFNDAILAAAMGCHVTEMLLLMTPKLNFYRVPADYRMEWYALGMFDGYQSVRRLENYAVSIKDDYFNFGDDASEENMPILVDSDTDL